MIQCNKLDRMTLHIIEIETKFYESKKLFDQTLAIMWKNHRELIRHRGMTTTLINLIETSLKILSDRSNVLFEFKLDTTLKNHTNDNNDCRVSSSLTKRIGFYSSLIIDVSNSLSFEQIRLLNRGPTYSVPVQLCISSEKQQQQDETRLRKKYAPLKHQLNLIFNKYHIHIALSMEIQKKIYDVFVKYFSTTILSDALRQQVFYETNTIHSIQSILKDQKLILRRTADHMNTFYLGSKDIFDKKAQNYIFDSNAYSLISSQMKECFDPMWRKELTSYIQSFNKLLLELKTHKAISIDVYKRLSSDEKKVKISYLYFLPDLSKVNMK